jgi:DNA-binding beta-propeller fold protein YncE
MSLRPALVANPLCRAQEKRTVHKSVCLASRGENQLRGNLMELRRVFKPMIGCVGTFFLMGLCAAAQTPSKVLLVLEKNGTQLDIIDPLSLKAVAKVPAGQDPHEVIASADGKLAYISNYGGAQSSLHMISVVDLVTQKALAPIDLGALHGAHGLDFAGGELYFTAETNKVIGRYNPSTKEIDWVMGTGQDRTHMVWVAPSLDKIVTSNVSSATISMIELVSQPNRGFGPPPGGGNQKSWEVTNVSVGRGSEGFDVSPDGKEIWTGNAQDGTVSIIDFSSKKLIQTSPISVRGANRLKFTPDGKLVLVSGLGMGPGAAPSGANLVVLDAASRKEVKQLSLGGGAAGILMDPDGSRAFVAVSGGNKVAIVDLKSLSVIGEIAPLEQPDGMAWAVRK